MRSITWLHRSYSAMTRDGGQHCALD